MSLLAFPRLVLLALAIAVTAPIVLLPAAAPPKEDSKDKDKGESLVIKPARTLEFSTAEAAWMSVDVSPDGSTLLVDLLGDLYTVAAAGGELKPLTTGMAWDYQARYSPDGKEIAFISDRNGSDSVWIMNADGSNPHAITKEKQYMFGSPAWSPDGQYVVARRYGSYPLESYLRKSELWLFHKDGGTGVGLVKNDGPHKRVSGPAFSADGKYIYFSSMAGPFAYNSDLAKWQLQRFHRESARIDAITARYGGGLRPQLTRDGKRLIYASRNDTKTMLMVRDLESRAERVLGRVTRDDQEGFSAEDTLPGYGVTSDGKQLFIAIDGKLKRIDIESGKAADVAFTAHVTREMGKLVKFDSRIGDGPFAAKQLRWLQSSADGSKIVFSAAGKLYAQTGGGSPARLTNATDREYAPEISPDSKWVAYVTWSDRDGGQLWKAPLTGGAPVRLSQSAALYNAPHWSPDGSRIAFVMGSASAWLGEEQDVLELRVVAAAGGKADVVTPMRTASPELAWSEDGKRIYYNETAPAPPASGERGSTSLVSMRPDGTDKRTHIKFADIVRITPAPNGEWAVVLRSGNAYLTAIPKDFGDAITVNPETPSVPFKEVTKTGALYPKWSADSSSFTLAFANKLQRFTRTELKPVTTEISLTLPRHLARGTLALRNARVVTMKGGEVLANADIVVENNRITAIGAAGAIAIPAGAHSMDLTGKTVIPGIVDIHAHLGEPTDIFPDKVWAYAANLAYGVTTVRDPSHESSKVFPMAEMIEAGEVFGPRTYSTGFPILSTNAKIESLEDARNVVIRYKEQGATSLKQYMQPRRLQRQLLLQAADEVGINITAEGGGFFKEDIAMALDGYTGFEHTLPYALHKDAIEAMAQSGVTYTPTLIVAYGGFFGQYFWRQSRDYHADKKLALFTPHDLLDRKTRRRQLLLDEEYFYPEISKGAREVMQRGGLVALGSHGEQQGIGAHWKLWMLAQGGMSPIEAIRAATLNGAKGLGLAQDIGSIEVGKIADMIVLDKNPLENIRNSEAIRYVIKNGEIFEGETLDRVWPEARKFGKFAWN